MGILHSKKLTNLTIYAHNLWALDKSNCNSEMGHRLPAKYVVDMGVKTLPMTYS